MGIYTLSFLDSCVPLHGGGRHIDNPIDCIADHHLAERQVCYVLDGIADPNQGNIEPNDLADVIRFLSVELPLHLQDEAEDLFPTMRVCCEPEDEIDRVIDRLTSDHEHSGRETQNVSRILRSLQQRPRDLDDDSRSALKSFAAHARRHLILENAVVLPIARARLSESDLERLKHNMQQRRKRFLLEEQNNAE